jgi:general secretion pathway protein J
MVFVVLTSNLRGGSLRFPLPWGEGQGEGVSPDSEARPSLIGITPSPQPSPHGRGGCLPACEHKTSRHAQHGFTLIEMLVSLSVMAVILTLLGGALRVMGRNWDVNAGRIETLDMVSRAFDLLARDAANLQRVVEPSGSPAYLFGGTADSLTFVALEPPQPGEAGLYFIAYNVASNGATAELIRSRAPYHQGMQRFPGTTPANRVPLLTGPYAYRFAYGLMVDGKQTWSADWAFPDRLPDLIRLQVLDRDRASALAPPMIVRLRADAELACLTPKPELCSPKTDGQLQAAKAKPPEFILR